MCVYAHIFMCELGMQCAAKSVGCRWTSEIALRSQTLSLNSALTAVGTDDEYKGLLLKQVGVYRVCLWEKASIVPRAVRFKIFLNK